MLAALRRLRAGPVLAPVKVESRSATEVEERSARPRVLSTTTACSSTLELTMTLATARVLSSKSNEWRGAFVRMSLRFSLTTKAKPPGGSGEHVIFRRLRFEPGSTTEDARE